MQIYKIMLYLFIISCISFYDFLPGEGQGRQGSVVESSILDGSDISINIINDLFIGQRNST